jgi:hypothetical protein
MAAPTSPPDALLGSNRFRIAPTGLGRSGGCRMQGQHSVMTRRSGELAGDARKLRKAWPSKLPMQCSWWREALRGAARADRARQAFRAQLEVSLR